MLFLLVKTVSKKRSSHPTSVPLQQKASDVIMLRSVPHKAIQFLQHSAQHFWRSRSRLAIHQPDQFRFAVFLVFSIGSLDDSIGKNHEPVTAIKTSGSHLIRRFWKNSN